MPSRKQMLEHIVTDLNFGTPVTNIRNIAAEIQGFDHPILVSLSEDLLKIASDIEDYEIGLLEFMNEHIYQQLSDESGAIEEEISSWAYAMAEEQLQQWVEEGEKIAGAGKEEWVKLVSKKDVLENRVKHLTQDNLEMALIIQHYKDTYGPAIDPPTKETP